MGQKSNNNPDEFFKKVNLEKEPDPRKKIWIFVVCLAVIAGGGYLFWSSDEDDIKPVDPVVDVGVKEEEKNITLETADTVDSAGVTKSVVVKQQVSTSGNVGIVEPAKSATNGATVRKNTSSGVMDVNIMAKRTIRGDFGNGMKRKDLLGDDYSVIQNKVNEFYSLGQLQW